MNRAFLQKVVPSQLTPAITDENNNKNILYTLWEESSGSVLVHLGQSLAKDRRDFLLRCCPTQRDQLSKRSNNSLVNPISFTVALELGQ